MLPLDDYLGSVVRTDRMMPDVMLLAQAKGVTSGVPLSINAFALLHDTDAFARTGLTPPGRDTTWDDFARLCVDMTNALDQKGVCAVGNAAR